MFTKKILMLLLLILLCVSVSSQVIFAQDQEPFKIGLITPLTGTFTANGVDMRDGVLLYLDEHDWVLGDRKIELFIEDSEGDPNTALTKARKLAELDKVDIICGPLLASSGYAVAEYARNNNFPYLCNIVSADDLTQRLYSDYVIRTGWSSSQPMQPFAEWVYNELGYRKVVTIAYDFAFGHETMSGFQYTFEEMGGKVVKKIWPPIGTPDYAPYLSQIPSDVDAVVANFSGSDALRFVRQYEEFGFKERFPLLGAGTLTDEHVLISMGDESLGTISALHYSAALDTPRNQKFVSKYISRNGRIPSYYSEGTYSSMMVLEAGLEGAGGVDDIGKFLEAVQGKPIDAPRGTFYIDEYNNPVQDIYIRKVEKVDGELQNTVIDTIEKVSQFWNYDPEEFLSKPVYSRDFPPVTE